MTITVTFALGIKESYFFNTPTHWAWHHLPADVEALFTSTPPIKDVIEFALGAHGTYFLSYYDASGHAQCKHYNLPNPLVEFLYAGHPTIVRDLPSLSVALGPWDSYYAWDRTSASWSNLPAALEKAVLSRVERQDASGATTAWKADGFEAPCFVSLGADGAYFMRTVCGGGSWDLKVPLGAGKGGLGVVGGDGMEGLRGTNRFLEEARDFSGVAGLHLFPANATAYVLVLITGNAFSNLPECTWADYNKLAPALSAFVQTKDPIPPVPVAVAVAVPAPASQHPHPHPHPQSPLPPQAPSHFSPQAHHHHHQPQFSTPPQPRVQGQMYGHGHGHGHGHGQGQGYVNAHAHAGAHATCCPPAVAPHNCCVPPPASNGGVYGP